MLEPQHIDNLKKLATYLEALPTDYKHFDMEVFSNIMDEDKYATKNGGLSSYTGMSNEGSTCGSVACAVGHGPAAGILVDSEFIHRGEVSWSLYCYESFGILITDLAFEWLFDQEWKYHDNTHYGAAARISYFLDHGIPSGFNYPDDIWIDNYKHLIKVLA